MENQKIRAVMLTVAQLIPHCTTAVALIYVGFLILGSMNNTVHRTYQTGENGYSLYLKQTEFADAAISLQVYIVNGASGVKALSTVIDLPQ